MQWLSAAVKSTQTSSEKDFAKYLDTKKKSLIWEILVHLLYSSDLAPPYCHVRFTRAVS